ncbi:TrbC family F-type conjugative pilus assembly protein [Desulfurobacterium sp. TC5-1]|uniref:TrbC family F-type conjugative pilus assembly protein n=1 Tax=Desulfurobacterium sp. TC5-1 TaxID=1158318 RepID=UPI0003B64A47|nr:TrbC family F-type conjugative pilus assembly protein [Desulfurobacterium sp. TC5-1]
MRYVVFLLLILIPFRAFGFDVTDNPQVRRMITELEKVIKKIENSTAVKREKEALKEQVKEVKKAVKKNGNYKSEKMKDKILPEDEKIYVLISSSVPLETLKAYVGEAERFNRDFVFVLRGTIGTVSKIRPTLLFIRRVISKGDREAYRVEFNLDPRPFRLINAESVPAFLLLKDGKPEAVVYGDVSLGYAVKKLYENTCNPYLEKLAEALGESPGLCSVRFTEKIGTIYPIKEKDLISEIEKRANRIDKNALIKKMQKKIYSWQPTDLPVLPAARKKRVYTFVPVYTLKRSIPRVKNGRVIGVLYPAGYTFNPLRYISSLPTVVFFNGNRKEEVEWVKKHLNDFNSDTLFCTTSGLAWKLGQKLGCRVYYATKDMVEKFHVKETVSVCRKKGETIEVTVVPVE